jgi:uncharacterized damage-inducible protein DinB
MTNEAAQGLFEILLPETRQESTVTRKLLAAVPAETYGYRPSEKCMSGLELASHIALSEAFFLRGVIHGNFDWKQEEFANPAAVLAYYDQTIPGLIEELAALPAEKLAQPVAFHTMNYSAVQYLILNLKHGIHHRGQLSSYLRPMGAKVPSIYGGSADEPMTAAAAE